MRRNMYVAVAVVMLVLWMAGCSGGDKSQEAAGVAEATVAGQAEEEKTEDISQASETSEAEKSEEPKETKENNGKETETPGTEETETEAEETSKEETTAVVKHSGFLFQSSGVTIGMNEDVAPILSGLGNYNNYAESPSCAFKGLDKIYSYNGFDLYTYPKGSVDYVNSIYFIDDSVSTPEGIRLGSTVEEMLAAYGDDYTEEYGVYTYTKEKSTLSFIVTDGVIESIEYVAITD